MKKSYKIFTLFLCLSFMSAQAQNDGFTLKANIGYGFGQKRVLGFKNITGDNSNSTENIYGSYGTGLDFGIGAYYGFSKSFELGFNVNYFKGKKQTTDYFENTGTYPRLDIWKASYTRVSLNPVVRFHTDREAKKLSFFAEGGLIIPVSDVTTWDFTQTLGGDDYVGVKKAWPNFALGCTIGVGIEYLLCSNFMLGFAVISNIYSVTDKRSEIVEYKANGTDDLDNFTEYDRRANYVDQLDQNSNNFSYNPNTDIGKPRDVLTMSMNGNNNTAMFTARIIF
jgi:hypothetical protein